MSETEDHDAGSVPGAPEPTKLRRRMFGYRRADVDAALGDRDALLAELRQDVAALWLAFAQHDRMIRQQLLGEAYPAPPEPEPPRPPDLPAVPSSDAIAAVEGAESIGKQLADLDDVLAAIEMATQTLERSYAEEVAAEPVTPDGVDEPPVAEPDEPARRDPPDDV